MNTNIRCLKAACDATGTPYELRHHSGNLLQVHSGERTHLFANWSTPFNLHSSANMSADKEYSLSLIHI